MSARMQFWLLQLLGWSVFVGALLLPWLGSYPLGGMLAAKVPLVGAGIAATLLLRALYRALLNRGAHGWSLAAAVGLASYAAGLAWSSSADLISRSVLHGAEHSSLIRLSFDRFGGTWYCAVVLAAWSLIYLGLTQFRALTKERERRVRSESLARQAKLEALRYQVNPHFLFNTLNAISTLVVEARTTEAARMISRLSDFLRLTLAGDAEAEIPLVEEIRFVREYLEIERVRFGERLAVSIEVGAELESMRVPALILLPIVENAVRHAVEHNARGGCISIRARRTDDRLRLIVSDDGPGESAMPIAGTGIGLSNTRARLQQLFGARQELRCIRSASGGSEYVLELPAQTAPIARRALVFA